MQLHSWIGKARSLIWTDDDGVSRYEPELVELFGALLAEPELLSGGQPRTGRHTSNSQTLYFDGDLLLVSAEMAQGESVRSHNHGAWNFTGVVTGAMLYQSYERLDDCSLPNYAKLQRMDPQVLRPGDVGICPPPPHDIHEVISLAPTTTVLLAPRFYEQRQYYFPDSSCYIESGSYPAAAGDGR